MVKRGFTIVELIIVITIMGILLILGVVNLNGSQANARDAERKSDIETIATALESVYDSGYYTISNDLKIGQYPSTTDLLPSDNTGPKKILKDIDIKALQAPSSLESSLIAATSPLTTTPLSLATPSKDNYIYQPLYFDKDTSTWRICDSDQECQKFNLYYTLETAISGKYTFPVESKHQ